MSGASGQCTCSTVFVMWRLPSLVADQPLRRQRLFDCQKIPPGKALLHRLEQQIGGMQRGNRADLTRAGMERQPASAGLKDTVLAVEQRLRRRTAEAHQNVRVGEFDLAQREGQTNRGFL